MKYIGLFLLLLLPFVLIHGALAFDDASVGVKVLYFDNVGAGDMSDNIFLGSEGSVGAGQATIALTDNGVPIVDDSLEDDDYNVPGILISRGADETGHYIDFIAPGFNSVDDRELVEFELTLSNSIFVSDENRPLGYWPVDTPNNGSCDLNKEHPELSSAKCLS